MSALVDGAWAGRTGNLGRYQRRSDGLLFSVYADEMGLGELRKNHVALIRQVLANLGLVLPHIRDGAFRDQAELPDSTYDYALHQLCLSLFPDTLYNEILGFNLGIELSGLGRQRMHQIQLLRAHGLDASYEEIHLSIDNLSAGHARQADGRHRQLPRRRRTRLRPRHRRPGVAADLARLRGVRLLRRPGPGQAARRRRRDW